MLNNKKINIAVIGLGNIGSYFCKEMLKKTNGARTLPQIFIDEHHVGGNAELQALERDGKLDLLLST